MSSIANTSESVFNVKKKSKSKEELRYLPLTSEKHSELATEN